MNTTLRTSSPLEVRTRRADGRRRRHQLPVCESTGLARYRDRHQATQAVRAMVRGSGRSEIHVMACSGCRGHHVEQTFKREPIRIPSARPAAAFTASLPTRPRRYLLADVENLSHGATGSCEEVAELWSIITQQALGLAPRDHVVVGAARFVVRRYRAAIDGANVRWVVGEDGPDGADRALLRAIDLRRVARDYDELVILSGDGAFAELARRAKSLGLRVHVVTTEHPSGRRNLSRDLESTADVRTVIRAESRARRAARVADITSTAAARPLVSTTIAA